MTKNFTLFVSAFCAVVSLLVSCTGDQNPAPAAVVTLPKTNTYMESHRPQFHFSPPEQWMNDPNGMVFYEGEYHLFYQHYPDSNVWGPMHWAHAISTDLAHWENLPIAIFPDSLGYIFSGSAVVDWNNTSGFGQNGKPPLVAMFTYHDPIKEKAGRKDVESQGIAYSNDRGRTWIKYAGNPALPNPGNQKDFRDPKVIWEEQSKQWVVVMAVGDHAEFWGSPDLKKWTLLSDFGQKFGAHGGVWECPDLFPIEVETETGVSSARKWILIININPGGPNGGSSAQYFVGNFDGKNFVLDADFAKSVTAGKGVWMDYGKDNYAGVTWSDVPKNDGRRLLIGWMSNWEYANVVPTKAWRNAATLPRKLTLRQTGEGYRLFSQPVTELEKIRAKSFELPQTELAGALDLSQQLGFSPARSELVLEFDLSNASCASLGVELSNSKNEKYRIGYNRAKNQFFSDRLQSGDHSFSKKFAAAVSTAPRISTSKSLRLHLFFDVSSMELFADNGASVMTELYFPSEDFNRLQLFSEAGKVTLVKASAWEVQRIWE